MDTHRPDVPSTDASMNGSDSGASDLRERFVSNALIHVGIPVHVLGYQFLRQAILLGLDQPGMLQHVSRNLYPVVATQCNSSSSRVERAIRHAINLAWDRGAPDVLNKMLGRHYYTPADKLSNCEFMSLMTEWARLHTHGK